MTAPRPLERLPEIKTHPKAEGMTGRAIDIVDRRGLMIEIDGDHIAEVASGSDGEAQ
ncbi:hypothetical protein AB0J35_18465 [Nonomuraea angiospora]|uniref:hypothetical protein n=1 Tax=Nonomuraea angiospora TaxID=46172 RepID=UPI0034362753